MKEKQPLALHSELITPHDMTVLGLATCLPLLVRIPPFPLAGVVGVLAWMVPLLAILPALGLFCILLSALKKRPDLSFQALIEDVLGKWMARPIFFLMVPCVFMQLCLSGRMLSERYTSNIYLSSSNLFFLFTLTLVVIYIARGSLGAMSRTALTLMILNLGLTLLISLIGLGDMQTNVLILPRLADAWPILKMVPHEMAYYSPLLFVFFLTPYVGDRGGLGRPVRRIITGLGAFSALSVMVTIGLLGPILVTRMSDPMFTALKNISSFQRPESFLTLTWGTGDLITAAALSRVVLCLICAGLGKPPASGRLTAPLMAAAFFGSALLGPEIFYVYGIARIAECVNMGLVILLPLLLLVVGKIRRKI